MGKLQTTIKKFRKAILDREEHAADRILAAYGDSYQRINMRMGAVIERIQLAQLQGVTISRDWVFRQARMQELLTQVEIEMHGFADFGTAQTTETQRQAVSVAVQHAQELIRQGPGPLPKAVTLPSNFTRFDPSAVQGFIGRSSDGSPLAKLFSVLVKDGRQAVEATFASNIIEGNSPRLLASQLKDQFNIPLTRALTISRTEVIGTYRETKINAFQQNENVVNGWRWTAALNGKTCAMCLAMDGKTFRNDTPFGSHPNCRCTPVPQTKSWAELGIEGVPDVRPVLPTGVDWFAKQPEKIQLQVLGPEKLDLYKRGELKLDDLIGYRVDRQWGPNRWERSLIQIRENRYRQSNRAMGVPL